MAPTSANYKLEVWGASGFAEKYSLTIAPPPGKGGYSYGYKSNVTALTRYYVCVGQRGQGQNCKPSYNNRYGTVPPEYVSCIYGGGATHIATTSNLGELAYYINNKNYVLLVAGGGGSSEWQSYGGAGGGERGLDGAGGDFHGTGASSTSGGTTGLLPGGGNTYYVNGAFGVGGYGYTYTNNFNDYGAQGGGGWYGGGGVVYNNASGGGSGHVGDVENGETIAGNKTFPSPSGGTETGHTGNGWAKIGWKL